MVAGEHTQTLFKYTRTLSSVTIDMIESIVNDKEVEVNDTETYDNGVKVVPTFTVEPVSVDVNNYKEALIDSKYYTEDEIGK